MDELYKAVIDRYNTVDAGVCDALRAANTGGMYAYLHKQDQAYPYMKYSRISESFNFYMDGAIKNARVQFSIFTDNLTDMANIYRKFNAAFEGATLAYGSDIQISCYAIDETGPTRMADDSWQATIDMEVMRY